MNRLNNVMSNDMISLLTRSKIPSPQHELSAAIKQFIEHAKLDIQSTVANNALGSAAIKFIGDDDEDKLGIKPDKRNGEEWLKD